MSRTSRVQADELAQAVDDLREILRAAVAGLVADGFTDREAHAIAAFAFSAKAESDGEGE